MGLSARLKRVEGARPPARCGRPVPGDPVAFARVFLAGAFGAGDLDPAHPHHTGWLSRVHAFLVTLGPEHQGWLRRARELDPRAHPRALVLPANEGAILAALDEVMRRG